VSIHDAEADLAKLRARERALEADLAEVRAEIGQKYLELAQRYGAGSAAVPAQPPMRPDHLSNADIVSQKAAAPLEDEPLIRACRGKSIPDAAIALIRLAGRPLSESEIVDQLKRGGVTFVSENPTLNVHFYLIKKRKETGVVKLTDKKLWTLGDNSVVDEPHNSGAVQNRDRDGHVERSRQGLLAARERGIKNGRQLTITAEQKELAERLLAQGMKFHEIATEIGVGSTTFLRWRSKGLVSTDRPIIPRRKKSSALRLVSSKS
jgi:hypothetical protein